MENVCQPPHLKDSKITYGTTVGIGIVITLLGAAMTFGIMWQKTDSVDRKLNDVDRKVDSLYNLIYQKLTYQSIDKNLLKEFLTADP